MMNWSWDDDRHRVECVHVGSAELRAGDRVVLRPSRRADILDMTLEGKTARIAALEQDFEGRIYVGVTVDTDPGNDLGALQKPGHRFFFFLDEIEPEGPEAVP